MKSKDKKDNLLDHMGNVFGQIIDHFPTNSLEKFEEVSYLTKNKENLSKYLKVEDNRNFTDMANSQKDFIAKGMAQFATAGGEDLEEGEAPALPEIGNV